MPWLWLAGGLLSWATVHDLRSREIPQWISLALVTVALLRWITGAQPEGWMGLAAGGLLALIAGLGLFALGALGGGDVKLLVGLGMLLGPRSLAEAAFWIALSGGLLALVAVKRKQSDLPYVPAIALGLLLYVLFPGQLAIWLGV